MPISSINSYSHWSLGNNDLNLWATSNLCQSENFVFSWRFLAILIDSHIRIVRRGSLPKIFNILKTSSSQTSITSIIIIFSWTVDKLLLAQTDRKWLIFTLNLIWLMSSSGCKSPAWSTFSLIFDRSNDALISPINSSFKSSIYFFLNGQGCKRNSFSKISFDKLFFC